ncbi:hypothetical protein N7478_006979 [Penicillium angulare]|uniref:uncharacterized protein n=1 Tax=Penicillium angulare TaxID=116970 RepID=UPI00253F8DF6|nr:uncharacterized protein N7478_006979 [Penicillium angulare]KAJ5281607.1 hypothetical protein N7478_006979 [Penicillium angulare]
MQTSFSKLQTTPTISPSITSLLAQTQLGQASSQGQGQTRAFSASASLGVRRVTFRPSRLVQKRRHGFLARNKSKKGRQTLTRRRVKGRRNMSW